MAQSLKSICLIKSEEPFWGEVKTFLSRTNAELFSLDSAQDLTVLEDLTPTLLIMNLATYISLPSHRGQLHETHCGGRRFLSDTFRAREQKKGRHDRLASGRKGIPGADFAVAHHSSQAIL